MKKLHDVNKFFFVNFLNISENLLSKDLCEIINNLSFNEEKLIPFKISYDDFVKFFTYMRETNLFYMKYWLKFITSKKNKNVPLHQEKILKNAIIFTVFLIRFRNYTNFVPTIQLNNPERKKLKMIAYIDDYIYKFYKSCYVLFDFKSFEILSKFLILLSTINFQSSSLSQFNDSQFESLYLFKLSVKIINDTIAKNKAITVNEIRYLKTFLKFILSRVQVEENSDKNKDNVFLLSKYDNFSKDLYSMVNVLRLLPLSNDHMKTEYMQIEQLLLDILFNIFHKNFTFHKVVSPLVNFTKDCLFNMENKNIDELIKDLLINQFAMKLYNNILNNDTDNDLPSGFDINDEHSTITVIQSNFHLQKSLLFFSFNLHPKENKMLYPIITFKGEKPTDVLSIIIICKGNNFFLYLGDQEICLINPYENYYCAMQKAKQLSIIINKMKNSSELTQTIPPFMNKNLVECQIGYIKEDIQEHHFRGILGSFIHVEVEDFEESKLIHYLNQYEKNLLSKYLYINQWEKTETYFPVKVNSLNLVVHPLPFQFVPFVHDQDKIDNQNAGLKIKKIEMDSFFEQNKEKNSKEKKTIPKIILQNKFSKNFYSFYKIPKYIEFINNDGLNYILLQLEYCYQLFIKNKTTTETSLLKLMYIFI